MREDPILYGIDTGSGSELSQEAMDDFKKWVLEDDLKPSIALQKYMEKYNNQNPHAFILIDLLKSAYPDLDIGRRGLRSRIIDAAYPNGDPEQFSDNDFDAGIEELLTTPRDW